MQQNPRLPRNSVAVPDIALFGSFPERGGIVSTLLNLTRAWVGRGLKVEIVLFRDGVPFYPEQLPSTVTVFRLGTKRKWSTQVALYRYLMKRKPAVLFSTKHVANLLVCRCRHLPRLHTKLVLGVNNNYFRDGTEVNTPARQSKFREIKRYYPLADAVITVSDGIRRALTEEAGLSGVAVRPIFNAIDIENIRNLAKEPAAHPWFETKDVPMLVSAGRLARQKDFPTMLRAFHATRRRLPCRLAILGRGPQKERLEALAGELGIADDVAFLGLVENPFAYMARADLFVLSSLWEGFGNVVAEALAIRVPVISTACPYGPAEILKRGEYGDLVPVGDWQALADAMTRSLSGRTRHFDHEVACKPFDAATAAGQYLQVFGLAASGEES